MVAACSALMGMSSGVWYTGSIFFVALIKEFGWGYSSTASIFSFFTVFFGVWAILIGYLVDRIGPRRVIQGGGVLLAAAMLGNGSAHALWHLLVTHSVLAALGLAATSYVPVSMILTRRFREQRGLAFGIASGGVGIGILIFVPLAQVLINGWGWRVAYRVLAIIVSMVILPVGFLALREDRAAPPADRPHDPTPVSAQGPHPSGDWTLASALGSREFWLVAASYVFLNGPTGLVMTHQVAVLVEAGQPQMLVAGIVGLVGLFSVPGKIGWGFLSDRAWLETVYSAGSGCLMASILILLTVGPTSSAWSLYGYAILIGLGYAVSPALNPILSGRFFAGRHFGLILGTLYTFYQGAAAVGIWLAGYAHDLTGSYHLPLVACIASACLAAGCVWLAAPRRIAR